MLQTLAYILTLCSSSLIRFLFKKMHAQYHCFGNINRFVVFLFVGWRAFWGVWFVLGFVAVLFVWLVFFYMEDFLLYLKQVCRWLQIKNCLCCAGSVPEGLWWGAAVSTPGQCFCRDSKQYIVALLCQTAQTFELWPKKHDSQFCLLSLSSLGGAY